MTRPRLGSLVMLVLACGDPEEGGTATDDGTSTGSSTSPSTTASTTTPSTSSATASSSATGTSTGEDTESTEPGSTGTSTSGEVATDTDPATTGSTGASSSSTGEPAASYPSCMMDDDCSEPYTVCWPTEMFGVPNFCTLECGNEKDCPAPTSGEAVPICEGPPDILICVLDCTDGACPTGMDCTDIFGDGEFMRCTWPDP